MITATKNWISKALEFYADKEDNLILIFLVENQKIY